MPGSENNSSGRVCLVGAGPGDEGLITVRGEQMLRRADVVIYDALANPRLLQHVRSQAERIPISPDGGRPKLTQDQINGLLHQRASSGLFVVRLKGGDPYMFGRGAEEITYLGDRGIACEVVPGVTAGLAVPMAAGIPLTRRDLASTVTFATGHEDATKGQTSIDYRAFAALIRAGGTGCIYMGAGRNGAIAEQLQRHGLPANTPVVAIQWGFTPRQRSVRTTLAATAATIEKTGLGPPMIIVIGRVAAINDPSLDFYARRPLFTKRIIVTRTRHQASHLYQLLTELGADVLEAPTIKLQPPGNFAPIDKAIRNIDQYDWLIFTSVNGVEALAERLATLKLDSRHLAGPQIAVIGDTTASALMQNLAIRADLMPKGFVGEELAEALIAQHDIRGSRFLMLRADIARPALRQRLGDAGAVVDDLAIYETKPPVALPNDVLTALGKGNVDWITFTSSSTVRNTIELLGPEAGLLKRVKIASIGPITSATVRRLGFDVSVEAGTSSLDGLITAMVEEESRSENRQPKPDS